MSLWILDTDTTSLLLRRNPKVSQQVQSMGADVAISIVTAQELFNGWVVRINNTKNVDELIQLYDKLSGIIRLYKAVTVLPFDKSAAVQLEALLQSQPALAKQRLQKDMRIAAIVLANNATIVTCNYRDFSLVPGLSITYGTLRERGLVKIESDLDSTIPQKPDFLKKSGFFDRTNQTRFVPIN
jgi:tRNA(fMet)-specific endonuclease VapC